MKEEKDYIKDISEIRSMMERSSRFLSLSGLSGVMAGIYALAGALVAFLVFGFNPDSFTYSMNSTAGVPANISSVIFVALIILALALGTVIYLSRRNAGKRGEKMWSATTRRLLANMMVPLSTGGILIVILILNGLAGLAAPISMIFYGLALFTASKMTLEEVKLMGIIQISLGLISILVIQYSLIIWALGFGLVNIVYGIYMHYKYER
jgi:predicted lysophospholipase L1 biosynthesis ABC-type transport system permease subunit